MDNTTRKNARTIKDSFEVIIINSKRNLNLIESDRDKEVYNSFFQKFLNNNNIKHYCRNTSSDAVFAERFIRTIRDLLKRPVFEKGVGNWKFTLPTKTKQYNNRVHSSTKLTPIQSSFKKNQGFAYKNLLDKRKKVKPKFQKRDLLRTTDSKKTFSKGDTTN